MRYLHLLVGIAILAPAFGIAGVFKVWDPHPLVGEVIHASGASLGHWEWLSRSVQILGGLEVAIALGLLIPKVRRVSLAGAFSLWLAFLIWDFERWARGGVASCGCFGEWDVITTWNGVVLKHCALLAGVLAVGLTVRTAEKLREPAQVPASSE